MISISIIVVTHNSQKFIESTLDSVFEQDFKACEVIVIDNASRDITRDIIKRKYPQVILVENPANLGPCQARNQGITMADGKFILCLDHDVRLSGGFLSTMHSSIETRDNLGAIGPKILMADAQTIYSTGIYRSFLRRFYDSGSGEKDPLYTAKRKKIFGISAAAALYRKDALEAIRQGQEYFDADFFYFFEDVDISWRLRKKGWDIAYLPEAACLHSGGRSRSQDNISQYLCMRNRYWLMIKNEDAIGFLLFPIIFLFYDLWRNLFMMTTNPGYFFPAFYEAIRLSPKMFRKRALSTD